MSKIIYPTVPPRRLNNNVRFPEGYKKKQPNCDVTKMSSEEILRRVAGCVDQNDPNYKIQQEKFRALYLKRSEELEKKRVKIGLPKIGFGPEDPFSLGNRADLDSVVSRMGFSPETFHTDLLEIQQIDETCAVVRKAMQEVFQKKRAAMTAPPSQATSVEPEAKPIAVLETKPISVFESADKEDVLRQLVALANKFEESSISTTEKFDIVPQIGGLIYKLKEPFVSQPVVEIPVVIKEESKELSLDGVRKLVDEGLAAVNSAKELLAKLEKREALMKLDALAQLNKTDQTNHESKDPGDFFFNK